MTGNLGALRWVHTPCAKEVHLIQQPRLSVPTQLIHHFHSTSYHAAPNILDFQMDMDFNKLTFKEESNLGNVFLEGNVNRLQQ